MEIDVLEVGNQIQLSNNEENELNIILKDDYINQGFNIQEIQRYKSKLSKEKQELISSGNGTKNAKEILSKESTT